MVTVKSLLSIASEMEFRLNAMPLCLKRKMSHVMWKAGIFQWWLQHATEKPYSTIHDDLFKRMANSKNVNNLPKLSFSENNSWALSAAPSPS